MRALSVSPVSPPLTFAEFLQWYPEDGKRYELIDGEIVEVRPAGKHEEIAGFLVKLFDREIERLGLPYFLPRTCCIKPHSDVDGYVPDAIVLDRDRLPEEPLWSSASTVMRGSSVRLVVEVVSTNWQDDYAKKLEDYEAMGIGEYWIVDYRALGGRRFIGSPKLPTLTVCSLQHGEYELERFCGDDAVRSRVFPELSLKAAAVLQVL